MFFLRKMSIRNSKAPDMNTLAATVPQGVLYFLPMMYIAWSDEVLTPTELSVIHKIK